MRGHFSFRQRLVMCERCQRPVAVNLAVCPHCDHHRLPQAAYIPRLPAPTYVGALPAVRIVRHAASGIPLRVLIVCVMAALAISGYAALRESDLDARVKAVSTYRLIGSNDEANRPAEAQTGRSNLFA